MVMSIDARQLGEAAPDQVLTVGNLEIHPTELDVFADDRRVGLTVREFETFMVLVSRLDRVVKRGDLYEQVWGRQMAAQDRSVDVFVKKVRQKLAACAPGWSYIHTHFGVGYRFAPERVRR
jgi:DNA-binding response OmpR family regulator